MAGDVEARGLSDCRAADRCEGDQAAADCRATAATAPVRSPEQASRQRLVGLDMIRGLTMIVMLVVDYTGGGYPSIDHASWDGLHLADFVMPWFLWVSGTSMSISLRVRPGQTRMSVFLYAFQRGVKLFVLGVILQGGWLARSGDLEALNLDLSRIRWMGILQRIAVVFVLVALVELFMPQLRSRARQSDSRALLQAEGSTPAASNSRGWLGFSVFRTNAPGWAVVLIIAAMGTGLTYGVKPPASWPGCAHEVFKCTGNLVGSGRCRPSDDLTELQQMGCSGSGYIDSKVLGVMHMYVKGNDVDQWPPTFGFDPEGFVTTFSAIVPMFLGLHVGKVWGQLKDPIAILYHWALLGAILMAVGAVLTTVVPFNKRLWSPSYSLFTSGAATLTYAWLFGMVDCTSSQPAWLKSVSGHVRTVLTPLQWLGANCILFFVLSDCCGVCSFVLQSISWGYPHHEKNIVWWFQNTVLMKWFNLGSGCSDYDTCGPALMAFVCIEIIMWMIICGVLYKKSVFWKI